MVTGKNAPATTGSSAATKSGQKRSRKSFGGATSTRANNPAAVIGTPSSYSKLVADKMDTIGGVRAEALGRRRSESGRKRSRKKASDDGGSGGDATSANTKKAKKAQTASGDDPAAAAAAAATTTCTPVLASAVASTTSASGIAAERRGLSRRAAAKYDGAKVDGDGQQKSAAAAFRAKANKAGVASTSAKKDCGIKSSISSTATAKKSAAKDTDSKKKEAAPTAASGKKQTYAAIFRFLLFVLAPTALFISILYIGAHREHEAIERAASTHTLYTEDTRVCGRVKTNNSGGSGFMTFASEKRARSHNDDDDAEEGGRVEIAHCGHCGKCSNMHDMTILAETKHTLTDTARTCGRRAYLESIFLQRGIDVYQNVSKECMEEKVGFTALCLECWLDDMVCGIQNCVFTCLKSLYLDFDPKNHNDGRINRCYECDEKICGPDFLKCSGTNRRRQGIRSDLARDGEKEFCRSVDIDWDGMAEAGGDGTDGVKKRRNKVPVTEL